MNQLSLPANCSVEEIFISVQEQVSSSIRISYIEISRPWGGFMVLDEQDIDSFIGLFFPGLSVAAPGTGKLSPKLLLVAPGKRLSWQYHHRRAEIWKLVAGQAGVVTSHTDEEQELKILQPGEIIELQKGERHRLVGLNEWGVIAEIWKHTDPSLPSDENDIVRLQDDFGR